MPAYCLPSSGTHICVQAAKSSAHCAPSPSHLVLLHSTALQCNIMVVTYDCHGHGHSGPTDPNLRWAWSDNHTLCCYSMQQMSSPDAQGVHTARASVCGSKGAPCMVLPAKLLPVLTNRTHFHAAPVSMRTGAPAASCITWASVHLW